VNVRYHAQRCVAAARRPGGIPDTLVCMVQIELPDGGITPLVIPEDEITATASGDLVKEELFIQDRVKSVITSMFAGATGDLQLSAN
jgi:hypothetical protein